MKWSKPVIKPSTSKYVGLQVQFFNPLNILSLFPWRWDTVDTKPHFRYIPAEQNSAEQLTCQVHSCCWEPSTHRYDSVRTPLDTICQPVQIPVLWILLLDGGGGQDGGPRAKRIQRMGQERILLTKVPGEVECVRVDTAVTLAPWPCTIFCPALWLTLQRGVTSAARHGENITCCGVTSTACHAVRCHSFDYISTTKGENVIGLLCSCSRRSWLS